MAAKAAQHREYPVVYIACPEGGYQVEVPGFPGLISYGRNLSEAKRMAADAIRCHLEGLRKSGCAHTPREWMLGTVTLSHPPSR